MKIDQDYLKKLLLACQASDDPTFDIEDLKRAGLDYGDPQFEFHMKILADQGFVERDDGDSGFRHFQKRRRLRLVVDSTSEADRLRSSIR